MFIFTIERKMKIICSSISTMHHSPMINSQIGTTMSTLTDEKNLDNLVNPKVFVCYIEKVDLNDPRLFLDKG